MLAKRLAELEQAGVVRSDPKEQGRGSTYWLTDAGTDLGSVIHVLGEWGERWVEVTSGHADPGFALWAWCRAQLDRSQLPANRVVVAFVFPDQPPGNRYYWLLVEHGDAEVCYVDPGGDPDLVVEAESVAFVDWHRGALSWSAAQRDGSRHGYRSPPSRPITGDLESPRSHRASLLKYRNCSNERHADRGERRAGDELGRSASPDYPPDWGTESWGPQNFWNGTRGVRRVRLAGRLCRFVQADRDESLEPTDLERWATAAYLTAARRRKHRCLVAGPRGLE